MCDPRGVRCFGPTNKVWVIGPYRCRVYGPMGVGGRWPKGK
jgi:hypothetical protein